MIHTLSAHFLFPESDWQRLASSWNLFWKWSLKISQYFESSHHISSDHIGVKSIDCNILHTSDNRHVWLSISHWATKCLQDSRLLRVIKGLDYGNCTVHSVPLWIKVLEYRNTGNRWIRVDTFWSERSACASRVTLQTGWQANVVISKFVVLF